VGPVIGEEGEGETAEMFGPCLEAGDGVGADLQDFDVELLELFVVLTEPEDLVPSPAGECERQERNYRLAALEAVQRQLAVHVRRKRKVGCLRTGL